MPTERILSPNLDKPWPPNQTSIDKFPVYDIVRKRPVFNEEKYRLNVRGAVNQYFSLKWPEVLELPTVEVEAHFHCVTKWSKERLVWEGIPMRYIVERAAPHDGVVQAMVRGLEGYTTNLPLDYLLQEDTLLAYKLNGQNLPQQHGAPLRLVVPQLYAWKSAKYVTSIVFQTDIRSGYWEDRGYHMLGDPWQEQRFTKPIEQIRVWWNKLRKTTPED